jgi:glycosyltransferase involved in cell wall biosynthesis
MNKVLFITYYWPPSGRASLHWPLKMIKFLPDFNWDPLVLTVNEDTFSYKDESMLNGIRPDLTVLRTNTIEPFNIYRKFLGKKKREPLISSETISKSNRSFNHLLSIWIRMNLFVPDARLGWYFPAVKTGKKFLSQNNINKIVSIGPPHTAHLIGKKLASKFNIDHIPVFIDPWVDIAYYREFKRSKPTLAIDNYFEKRVLKNAKKIVFITETMKDDYTKKYAFIKDKSHVLYWGFNEDDFKDAESQIGNANSGEVLVHAGNIFDYQNPVNFWKEIKRQIDNGRKLKIKFIGTVSPGIRKTIEEISLTTHTDYLGFLPYKEMLKELMKASYLIVCATEPRHIPGKLFEYLRTGKPIIAFGDNNLELKKILLETNSGILFYYKENGKEFFNKSNEFKRDEEKLKRFDRRYIAKELAKILKG